VLSLEEKKEQVILQYTLSYDIDIAMTKVDLTPDEKKMLLRDEDFLYRLNYQDALIRERIVSTMLENLTAGDPRLTQKAAIDLGNLLWKEKFKSTESTSTKNQVPDTIILKGKKAKSKGKKIEPHIATKDDKVAV